MVPHNDPTPSLAAAESVLVVEDEVLVRMVIADNLRNAGYTVIEASNAHEALGLLRSNVDVRLILSDVRMPGTMNGLALARTVRSEFPVIKIVLTSGTLRAWSGPDTMGSFRNLMMRPKSLGTSTHC